MGPYRTVLRTLKYRDTKGTKAVHDRRGGFGYKGYTGTGAVSDRDAREDFRTGREELLVFPKKEPRPTVFPESKRGKELKYRDKIFKLFIGFYYSITIML